MLWKIKLKIHNRLSKIFNKTCFPNKTLINKIDQVEYVCSKKKDQVEYVN